MNKLFRIITFISGLMISAQVCAAAPSNLENVVMRAAREFTVRQFITENTAHVRSSQRNSDARVVAEILQDESSYIGASSIGVVLTPQAARELFAAGLRDRDERYDGERISQQLVSARSQLKVAHADLAIANARLTNLGSELRVANANLAAANEEIMDHAFYRGVTFISTGLVAAASGLAAWLWLKK